MKKYLIGLVIVGLAAAGCAKKEAATSEEKAKQNLIEGTVFLKQGDVKGAVESFAAAIKTDPEYFEGYFMLGETLVRLKQYPQAVSIMSNAARQFPNNGLAFYLLAIAHEGAQQPMPAIAAARHSVDLFNASGDQQGQQRAMILLAALVQSAKQESEKQMVENAAKDAAKAIPVAQAVPVSANTLAH